MKPLFPCECLDVVNEELAKQNGALLTNILGRPGMMFVATYKVDSKKRAKPSLVCASFCPFCGSAKTDAQL